MRKWCHYCGERHFAPFCLLSIFNECRFYYAQRRFLVSLSEAAKDRAAFCSEEVTAREAFYSEEDVQFQRIMRGRQVFFHLNILLYGFNNDAEEPESIGREYLKLIFEFYKNKFFENHAQSFKRNFGRDEIYKTLAGIRRAPLHCAIIGGARKYLERSKVLHELDYDYRCFNSPHEFIMTPRSALRIEKKWSRSTDIPHLFGEDSRENLEAYGGYFDIIILEGLPLCAYNSEFLNQIIFVSKRNQTVVLVIGYDIHYQAHTELLLRTDVAFDSLLGGARNPEYRDIMDRSFLCVTPNIGEFRNRFSAYLVL